VKRPVWTFPLLACAMTRSVLAEPSKADVAVARQYFDAAAAAESQGRWRDALDQLSKAVAIKETAGLRYHLGFAKENLGLIADALLEYQRASALVRSSATSEQVERLIVPKLAEMRRRVPTLTVTVPVDVKDAQLRIDGAAVKSEVLGTSIPLNPGTHSLAVAAPGRRTFHTQVTVGEGSTVTQAAELMLEVETAAISAPAPPPTTTHAESRPSPPPAEPGGSAMTWVLLGEGAVTLAGLGVGFGYFAAANAAQVRYDQANARLGAASLPTGCSNPPDASKADCANLNDAYMERRRDNNLALAGFVGAGVGAAALAATWLFWKSPDRATAKVTLKPRIGLRESGLSVTLTH